MFLHIDATWNKHRTVAVTKQWYLFSPFLSNLSLISAQMSNLSVMRSWSSAHLGPVSLTTLLLEVSWARSEWICLLFRRPGPFSANNSINILIMNLDDSKTRLSDFQTWPFVRLRLWDQSSSGFGSCHF